jgi:hypothetical protein
MEIMICKIVLFYKTIKFLLNTLGVIAGVLYRISLANINKYNKLKVISAVIF